MSAKIVAYSDESEIVYLDNAATTWPKPRIVHEFAHDFYRRYGGNAGRGNNPFARACSRLLDETRYKVAAWLDAPTPEQLIFTSSATHALNLAILGHRFHAGDVIYVSRFEHNSVLRPIEHLRQTKGIQVRLIPFNRQTYACELDKLEAAFQIEPPAMVCVTQASNVCGIMPPVVEIARLAKKVMPHAIIVVDGAQTAGLYPLPLQDGLIDALIFSGHKSLYALYGVAGVVFGTDWRPKPLLFGGTGTVSESVEMPTTLPSAYEAGSQNILAIAGLSAAVDWLERIGREQVTRATLVIALQIQEELQKRPQLDVFPSQQVDSWCGITSFCVDGITPQALETVLGAERIAIRAGLHCSPWTHDWLGTKNRGGTVRISPSYHTSPQDIDLLFKSISLIAQ